VLQLPPGLELSTGALPKLVPKGVPSFPWLAFKERRVTLLAALAIGGGVR
jgi:hypothetical protein